MVDCELGLTDWSGRDIELMRSTIFHELRSSHVGSDTTLAIKIEFYLHRDPSACLKQQFPHCPASSLCKVIVLCGSKTQAQASTCSSYMGQVWPKSGPQLLSALETCLDTNQPYKSQYSKTLTFYRFLDVLKRLKVNNSMGLSSKYSS